MASFSVIVTAHNMEPVIGRTLASVEAAIQELHRRGAAEVADGEIVVVEDGSSDGTWRAIEMQARGKALYRLGRRAPPSSPRWARDSRVEASTGQLLLLL